MLRVEKSNNDLPFLNTTLIAHKEFKMYTGIDKTSLNMYLASNYAKNKVSVPDDYPFSVVHAIFIESSPEDDSNLFGKLYIEEMMTDEDWGNILLRSYIPIPYGAYLYMDFYTLAIVIGDYTILLQDLTELESAKDFNELEQFFDNKNCFLSIAYKNSIDDDKDMILDGIKLESYKYDKEKETLQLNMLHKSKPMFVTMSIKSCKDLNILSNGFMCIDSSFVVIFADVSFRVNASEDIPPFKAAETYIDDLIKEYAKELEDIKEKEEKLQKEKDKKLFESSLKVVMPLLKDITKLKADSLIYIKDKTAIDDINYHAGAILNTVLSIAYTKQNAEALNILLDKIRNEK